MKRTDLYFIVAIAAIFLPFFLSAPLYEWYSTFNATHGMVMSFLKFGILSTLGEMLGCRISTGKYVTPTFGVLPRMVVWGFLGMGINMAMIIFSKGTPMFMQYMGMTNAVEAFTTDGFSMDKLWVALAVSVAMNTIFAPVFMTFHKVTDAHIAAHNGSLKALVTPIPMAERLGTLNWQAQWGFVFRKTIPFFWYPAHTITFLLPAEQRVLFAALLGIVLGVLLAVSVKK
ncbi:MAG: hypothetical protein II261_07555 [Bacteroidaceae bacterium]|jgi:hypothetical protein|nr:hypothetical protein [Bacteroidaceae bacterium]